MTRRVRPRRWWVWMGMIASAALIVGCCTARRWHHVWPVEWLLGDGWEVTLDIDAGWAAVKWRLNLNPMSPINGSSITILKQPEVPLIPRWTLERAGFVKIPVWMVGLAVAAVGGVVALRRRPGMVRELGSFVTVVMIAVSGLSFVAETTGSLDQIVRWERGSAGIVIEESGIGVLAASIDPYIDPWERISPTVAWFAIDMHLRYGRPGRKLAYGGVSSVHGWAGLYAGQAEFAARGLTVRTALASWWLMIAVIGVPTMIGCWRSRRVEDDGVCRGCGYDLSGRTGRVCPECGREATPG